MSAIRDVLNDMITLDEELKHYVVNYFEFKLNECICAKDEDFEDRVVEVFDKNGHIFLGGGRCSNGVYAYVLERVIPALKGQKAA